MVWVLIGIALLLLSVLFLFARVYVTCHFTYGEKTPSLTVRIKVFHIPIVKRKMNLFIEEGSILDHLNVETFSGKGNNFIDLLKEMNHSVSVLFGKLLIHKFDWITEGGTGEAVSTGLAGAGIWTVKGGVVSYIAEKSSLKCRPLIQFQPYFQQKCFRMSLECIVSIQIGQAIHAFLKLIRSK